MNTRGTYRPQLLVVCGRNKKRSRTAEFMYKQDDRCKVRSAGLSPQSERKLSEQDLHWADLVLVMETDQRSKIRSLYGQLELPEILVLDIPDEYEFMDEELVDMLHDKIEALLQTRYDL